MFWDRSIEKEQLRIAFEEKQLKHDDINRAAERALEEKRIVHDNNNRREERVLNNRKMWIGNLTLLALGICFVIGAVNFGTGNGKVILKVLSVVEGMKNLRLGNSIVQFVLYLLDLWGI